MALGIIEPKTDERPPGTELLVDDDAQREQVREEQGGLKHGKGKVRFTTTTISGTFVE